MNIIVNALIDAGFIPEHTGQFQAISPIEILLNELEQSQDFDTLNALYDLINQGETNFVGELLQSVVDEDFDEEDIDDYIDWLEHVYDGELDDNPCTKEVYKKLKNTPTMFKVLKQFMGEKPIAHLEWKVENIVSGANGSTGVYVNNQLIKIRIDPDYVNSASSISMARTMLHEALHAEVLLKLISVGAWPLDNNDLHLENEFPGIWDFWVRFNNNLPINQAIPNTLHNHMANWYREKIKEGLKEFDEANGTSHTEWQYEALSWGGLYGTAAWSALPSTTRTQYNNYIQQEQNSGNCP